MVKEVKLNVVVDNSASIDIPHVWAQHGFCLLLQIELSNSDRFTVLMDTGPSPDVTLHNVEVLRLDLSEVDLILLSHGHYDHTGGLIGVLKRTGKSMPVITHPSIFNPKLKVKPSLKFIGPPYTAMQAEAAGGVMIYARNPVTLAKDVLTTGEVERIMLFEKVEGFETIEDERFTEDRIPDDQALIVNIEGRGLAIFSGCAHSGIVNTVRHAQRITGVKDIFAVVGGFHLAKTSEDRIRSTIDELKKLDPKVVGPGHCTGVKAISRLMEAFGDRCIPLATGERLEL